MDKREHCKKLWLANKEYVEANIDTMHIDEARLFAWKQNALYKAWFDGDFSELNAVH